MSSLLTVEEIRSLKPFGADCEIIADNDALIRTVSWAVYTDPQSLKKHYSRGGELFFISSEHFSSRFTDLKLLQELTAANASGLCIENGLVYHDLSESARAFAQENHFPVFLFNKILNTSSLITKINRMILDSQGSDSENEVAEAFNRKLLEIEEESELIDILNYTASLLNLNCGYWHVLSEPVSTDGEDIRQRLAPYREELLALPENETWQKDGLAVCCIRVLQEPYAVVYLTGREEYTQFELLILRRLTAFLSNRIVGRFIERLQRQHSKDSQWVKFWLEGKLSSRLIADHLAKMGLGRTEGFIVGVVRPPYSTSHSYNYRRSFESDHRIVNDSILQTSMLMFRSFRREGFSSVQLIEESSGLMWHVYIAPEGMHDWKQRWQKAVKRIRENEDFLKGQSELHLGQASCEDPNDLHQAGLKADYCRQLSLDLPEKVIVYEDLHLLKILDTINRNSLLETFIEEELGELLNEENAELLETLRCYFNCNCKKNKAAEELYIVRQTLYIRLERIEEILGEDFDQDGRRVALEIALAGLNYRK